MRIGSLCSGYGGLDLAVEAHYGATPAWFAEFDPAPSKVLAHHWPGVPNLRDLTAVDWRTVEPVDLLIGGIPCQPFSVRRWEHALGRPAPAPTEPGRDGRPRLSPALVEWMMGLPAGHVTDPAIGLTRNQQLKALGNGVVPQQAAHALRLLDEIAQVAA